MGIIPSWTRTKALKWVVGSVHRSKNASAPTATTTQSTHKKSVNVQRLRISLRLSTLTSYSTPTAPQPNHEFHSRKLGPRLQPKQIVRKLFPQIYAKSVAVQQMLRTSLIVCSRLQLIGSLISQLPQSSNNDNLDLISPSTTQRHTLRLSLTNTGATLCRATRGGMKASSTQQALSTWTKVDRSPFTQVQPSRLTTNTNQRTKVLYPQLVPSHITSTSTLIQLYRKIAEHPATISCLRGRVFQLKVCPPLTPGLSFKLKTIATYMVPLPITRPTLVDTQQITNLTQVSTCVNTRWCGKSASSNTLKNHSKNPSVKASATSEKRFCSERPPQRISERLSRSKLKL